MKSKLLVLLTTLVLFFSLLPVYAQEKDAELWEEAKKIHFDAIVIDAHAHPMWSPDGLPENLDLGRKTEFSSVDFISMKEGGLDAAFFSLPLLNAPDKGNPSKRILDDIVFLRSHINKHPGLAKIALTPSDIREIHDSGKRAIMFGIETPDTLEGHTVLLGAYYEMGVRMITVAHSQMDPIADTDREGVRKYGLSQFGKGVILEMNKLGMLIDISHATDDLQLSIIKESKAPVVASHSCVRTLNDSPRETSDEILKEIARNDGAIMITFSSSHLSSHDEVVEMELLIDHINHAVKIAGIDHVGLGSDFIDGDGNPIGLETAAGYALITYHLLKRGYKAEGIKKILGENFLRIFSEVENISSQLILTEKGRKPR